MHLLHRARRNRPIFNRPLTPDELKEEADKSYDPASGWTCPYCCHNERKKRSNFFTHLQTHFPKGTGGLICVSCRSTFTLKGTLIRHLQKGSSRCRERRSADTGGVAGQTTYLPPARPSTKLTLEYILHPLINEVTTENTEIDVA